MHLAAWTPDASVDWRFLPNMPSSGKALLCTNEKATMAVGLLSAFEQVVVLTETETAVFPQQLSGNGRLLIHHPQKTALEPNNFDLVALPLGFTQPPAKQLGAIKQLLKPNGALYLGIQNRWSYRRWQGRKTVGETMWSLHQTKKELARAGFHRITAYGLVPDLAQPQTIFPLTTDAISLALARSWRKIDTERAQTWTSRWPLNQMLPYVLPSYGLVAHTAAFGSMASGLSRFGHVRCRFCAKSGRGPD
ncbi:MAG: hypothetical protein AAF614_44330 [Chloroflexota bacterium]